ncbi:MAG: 30S ribosomal protein S5 [Candidatus Aenigmarchaeota archaeon]|nr:30S ribosomal protein S5 [Candidatus Aenigmarchaeota archaeon]
MEWNPKTMLGKEVMRGEINDLGFVFKEGRKIQEPQIVDALLPNLKSDVILFGGSPGKGGGIQRTTTRRTVRMHRSGRRFTISALVVVGSPGYIGLGKSSSPEHRVAIEKATQNAKLNIIPVRRGCGSWQCSCSEGHSIPMVAEGKSGAVVVKLLPAPKGVGLCIGDEGKKVMRLAGIKDIWTKAVGNTRTRVNYISALIDAFKNLNKSRIELPEAGKAGVTENAGSFSGEVPEESSAEAGGES